MTDNESAKPRFKSQDFGVSSFKRNEWHLVLQPSQSMDDVSNPYLWKDIADKQKAGDTVEVFKPDTSEWALFVIFEVGTNFIRLGKTITAAMPEVKEPEGQLIPKWNVGKRSFDVVRKADNYVMAKDFQTKASAVEWINDHQSKMAA